MNRCGPQTHFDADSMKSQNMMLLLFEQNIAVVRMATVLKSTLSVKKEFHFSKSMPAQNEIPFLLLRS